MTKIEGILQNQPEPIFVKEGTQKKDPSKTYRMYRCVLTVNDTDYSLVEFSETAMKERCALLKQGSHVEFEAVQDGDFLNVNRTGTMNIKPPEAGAPAPAPPAQQQKPIGGNVPADVWRDKELREIRGKAIMYALKTDENRIKAEATHVTDPGKIEPASDVTIMNTARNYVHMIYEGTKDAPKEGGK